MTDSKKPTLPSSGPGAKEPIKQACATCPKYLTFQVKDANSRLCVGMYYSVYIEGAGWEVKNGVLDTNAKTRTFSTTESGTKVLLYVGHRLEEGRPEANAYDEAPLDVDAISSGEPTYTVEVTTKRLWKPWTFSLEAAKECKTEWEEERRYVYDDRAPDKNWDGASGPVGTLTIGAGHALSRAEARSWYERYPPSGAGMSDAEIARLYADDIQNRADVADLHHDVHVPLYQREFDALTDFRFNAGHGASDFSGGRSNTGKHDKISKGSISGYLNSGSYTEAGNRILTTANTIDGRWSKGVQNRRNFQRGMFFGESWQRE